MSLNILLYSAGCHQMFNKNAIFKYTKHYSINGKSVFIHSIQVSTGIVSYSAVFQISLKSFGRSWCTLGFHVSEDFSEIF